MSDPHQPAPGAPRPASVPQTPQPHAPQQHPSQPHAPQTHVPQAHPTHPQQPQPARPTQQPQVPHTPQQHPQQQSHPPGMMPGAGAPRPAMRPPGAAPAQPAGHNNGPARIAAMPSMAPPSHNDESIALIDDGDDAPVLHSKIKAFGDGVVRAAHKWARTPVATGHGPVRIRTFHAKLSDQGLEYLDDAINHFIDEHPEVDIKFVTSNVGMFDGKFKDLALVVNIWY